MGNAWGASASSLSLPTVCSRAAVPGGQAVLQRPEGTDRSLQRSWVQGPKWSPTTHGTLELLAPAITWGSSSSVGTAGHLFFCSFIYSFTHSLGV